jgi:holin-like protein
MKFIKQIAIILGIYIAGETIRQLTHIPIPGNVLGMVILFTLLSTGVLKRETIREITNMVLSNMTLFFIPASVAIFAYFGLIANVAWHYIVLVIVSSIAVIAVTGYSAQLVQLVVRKAIKKKDTGGQ